MRACTHTHIDIYTCIYSHRRAADIQQSQARTYTCIYSHKHTIRQIHTQRQTDRQVSIYSQRHTDRYTDTERQTHLHMCIYSHRQTGTHTHTHHTLILKPFTYLRGVMIEEVSNTGVCAPTAGMKPVEGAETKEIP